MDNTPFFACIASGIVYNKDILREKTRKMTILLYTILSLTAFFAYATAVAYYQMFKEEFGEL